MLRVDRRKVETTHFMEIKPASIYAIWRIPACYFWHHEKDVDTTAARIGTGLAYYPDGLAKHSTESGICVKWIWTNTATNSRCHRTVGYTGPHELHTRSSQIG